MDNLYITGVNWNLSRIPSLTRSFLEIQENRTIVSCADTEAETYMYFNYTMLPLERTVEVELDDGSYTDVEIHWDFTGYDSGQAGTFEFPGTFINLPDDINPGTITPKLLVTFVVNPNHLSIISFIAPGRIQKKLGTPFLGLGLPDTVTAVLNDGSQRALDVHWRSDSYSPEIEGFQSVVGYFKNLPANIDNRLTVLPKTSVLLVNPEIGGFKPFDKITVDYDTPFAQLGLPRKAEVFFKSETWVRGIDVLGANWDTSRSPGLTREQYYIQSEKINVETEDTILVDIQWSIEGYQPKTSGLQVVYGDLTNLPIGISNPEGIRASIHVEISEPIYENIELDFIGEFSNAYVAHGTEFSELNLPDTVKAYYSNNTSENVPIEWKAGSYNPNQSGEYRLFGDLVLPEYVDNPENVRTKINIFVGEEQIYFKRTEIILKELQVIPKLERIKSMLQFERTQDLKTIQFFSK